MNDTFTKTLKVINSCKTYNHLINAKMYMVLAFKNLDGFQIITVINQYNTQLKEMRKQ